MRLKCADPGKKNENKINKGCNQTTRVFSNSQTVIQCSKCASVMATPTGGRVKIAERVGYKPQRY